MDRLFVDALLHIDEELESNNGYFRLRLTSTGGLVLYRAQLGMGHAMWTSGGGTHAKAYAKMQADGSFILRSGRSAPYWSTPTAGHAGAYIVLQDNGNLVVLDPTGPLLWQSYTEQDMLSPTIRYDGEGGYTYDETSEYWKEMCRAFPCFYALQWPGYASDIFEDEINGQAVVIQLWKGWCQKFLGSTYFPGGIGAEVGVYRRIPGKVRPPALSLPASDFGTRIASGLSTLSDNELWWPAPELGATLEFSFINPLSGETIFSAGPEKSYWLTKWMEELSYLQYQSNHSTPANPADYILEYTINGRRRRQWPPGQKDINDETRPAWMLLLS